MCSDTGYVWGTQDLREGDPGRPFIPRAAIGLLGFRAVRDAGGASRRAVRAVVSVWA